MTEQEKKVMTEARVVELKKGHYYIAVFDRHVVSTENVRQVARVLAAEGIDVLFMAINGEPGEMLTIIDTGETPPEVPKSPILTPGN